LVSFTNGIDPRRVLPNGGISFVKWEPGRNYSYYFVSKAAHTDVKLPAPEKVNPQTSLEDLGLLSFATIRGHLALECLCHESTVDGDSLFKATIAGVHSKCIEDSVKVDNNCDGLQSLALSLTSNPFWLTVNAIGEITGLTFPQSETPEVISIKKNLVGELSMTAPETEENKVMFTRSRHFGVTKYTTRYRVHPYSRHPDRTPLRINGVIVRKEKTTNRPPQGNEVGRYRRNTWVYMVIGGDVAPESSPAPVPTRVASLEQVRVDPAFLKLNKNDTMYVLSRVVMELTEIKTIKRESECVLPFQKNAQGVTDLSFLQENEQQQVTQRSKRTTTAQYVNPDSDLYVPLGLVFHNQ